MAQPANFWSKKQVLVTGGAGFIGSHLVEKLIASGSEVTVFDKINPGRLGKLSHLKEKFKYIQGNCTDKESVVAACREKQVVMNLAAKVAGVDYNNVHSGTMLAENLLIESTVTNAAQKAGVEYFLVVSSACVYPGNCSIPTPESEGFIGEPEYANRGYGWAKRMSELLGKYYQEEFGMKVAIVRPYNCYGPRDHFDPTPTHVVPALIKRAVSGENPVVVWGSGKQTRAFLYVEDLVEGMMKAVERYPTADPVNLGTDEEVTIRKLVHEIIRLNGSKAKIVFDTSKPDGSLRRNSDNKKAYEKIGFRAKTTLQEGLQKTIEWYKAFIDIKAMKQ